MVPLTARFGVFYLLSLSVSAATSILTSSTTVASIIITGRYEGVVSSQGAPVGRVADEKARWTGTSCRWL